MRKSGFPTGGESPNIFSLNPLFAPLPVLSVNGFNVMFVSLALNYLQIANYRA